MRFVLGRSHGRDRTYVRGEEPWDALPSDGDRELCADMHALDNRKRRVRRRSAANFGGDA